MKTSKKKSKTNKRNLKTLKINSDLSNLRKPIDSSVSNLFEVVKILENGSHEIRTILTYECDVIYECKVCKSLFRSLVNFISHKRVYCTDKSNITINGNISHDYSMVLGDDILPLIDKPVLRRPGENNRILRSQSTKDVEKDLSNIIDMLENEQKLLRNNNCSTENSDHTQEDTTKVFLEPIEDNSSAVYQTVLPPKTPVNDDNELMKSQIGEIHNMINDTTAVLDSQGEILPNSDPLDNLKCVTCDAKFSSKKTLKFHMKKLHTHLQTYFPCPCCSQKFTNTWGVYRHLYKVHKKSNEQVRKLRKEIQDTSFCQEASQTKNCKKPEKKFVEELKVNQDDTSTTVITDQIGEMNDSTEIRVQAISCLRDPSYGTVVDTNEEINSSVKEDNDDVPEIVYSSMNVPTKTSPTLNKRKMSSPACLRNAITVPEDNPSIEMKDPIVQNHASVMENKIAAIANLSKLQCLLCKRKFSSMTNLRRHMAIHIGWNRYSCKLCDFKCFVKCDCVAHCNKIHNAQNNRNLIADMIIQIPQEALTQEQSTGFSPPPIKKLHLDDELPLENDPTEDITEEKFILTAEMQQRNNSSNDTNKIDEIKSTPDENPNDDNSMTDLFKFDDNSDMKRMVMEVIFGSSFESTTIDTTESLEIKTDAIEIEKKPPPEDVMEIEKEKRLRVVIKNQIMPFAKGNSKKYGSKPQRPTRKRVKPMNKDFIYDLKEIAYRSRESHLKNQFSNNKTQGTSKKMDIAVPIVHKDSLKNDHLSSNDLDDDSNHNVDESIQSSIEQIIYNPSV